MPILVDHEVATPWTIKIVAPADYLVVTSGVQTERLVNQDALHVYEVEKAVKIGLFCCKFPIITPI
jgi:hypothetical protein